MPHSVLVYRDIPSEIRMPRATVIALHGASGRLGDLEPVMQALNGDTERVMPEAARGVHDLYHQVVGYSWYGGTSLARPEPASFGDSLAQLERFIYDVRERSENPGPVRPWLIGYEQGAFMALAAAGVLSDLLSGVVAVCGAIPEIRGWDPLPEEPHGLPILFITDPNDPVVTTQLADESVGRLRAWGANVARREVDDARLFGPSTVKAARAWLACHVDTS